MSKGEELRRWFRTRGSMCKQPCQEAKSGSEGKIDHEGKLRTSLC